MYCEKCGKPINENEKFCPNCGNPIQYNSNGNSGNGSKREMYILIGILCVLVIAIAALVFVYFIAPGMRSDKEPSNDNKAAAEASESEQTEAPQTQAQTQVPQTEAVPQTQVPQTETAPETQPATPDNGIHFYEYYIEDVSWTTAQSRCREKGGKLLTLDTEEEYTYIKDQIRSKGYDKKIFYLGGARSSGSHEYYWLDANGSAYGSSLNSSYNWMRGEPSYEDDTINVSEVYMDFFYYSSESRWIWNDIPNDLVGIVPSYSGKIGYICEFEE